MQKCVTQTVIYKIIGTIKKEGGIPYKINITIKKLHLFFKEQK